MCGSTSPSRRKIAKNSDSDQGAAQALVTTGIVTEFTKWDFYHFGRDNRRAVGPADMIEACEKNLGLLSDGEEKKLKDVVVTATDQGHLSELVKMADTDSRASVLFDFDCNLTHEDLARDVDDLLTTSASVGVTEMLVPGATLEESSAAIALCAQHPTKLFPTAGVHPYNAHALPAPDELARLHQLATEPSVLAVGECGLDYSDSFPDAKLQQAWFVDQLELACELQKPLFLHERLAHLDFLRLIDQVKTKFSGYMPPAVVHCFTGTEEELLEYVRRDFYIGVTGHICKKDRGAELRAMIRHVPVDKLVIETDAPYMGFPKCRSKEKLNAKKQYPNVPSSLPLVCEVVATALGMTPQEVARITRANARRFLRLAA